MFREVPQIIVERNASLTDVMDNFLFRHRYCLHLTKTGPARQEPTKEDRQVHLDLRRRRIPRTLLAAPGRLLRPIVEIRHRHRPHKQGRATQQGLHEGLRVPWVHRREGATLQGGGQLFRAGVEVRG